MLSAWGGSYFSIELYPIADDRRTAPRAVVVRLVRRGVLPFPAGRAGHGHDGWRFGLYHTLAGLACKEIQPVNHGTEAEQNGACGCAAQANPRGHGPPTARATAAANLR